MSKRRVLRGGSCLSGAWGLRATFRVSFEPEIRCRYYGFRIVIKRRKP